MNIKGKIELIRDRKHITAQVVGHISTHDELASQLRLSMPTL
jgi:hypothetical protein